MTANHRGWGRPYRLPATFLLTMLALLLAHCSNPTEGTCRKGHYEGYIGLGANVSQVATGELTIDIDRSDACTLAGTISGEWTPWGDFELSFCGEPWIRTCGDMMAHLTCRRVRAGIDTLEAAVTLYGDFSSTSPSIYGQWYTDDGSPFAASGLWSVLKN